MQHGLYKGTTRLIRYVSTLTKAEKVSGVLRVGMLCHSPQRTGLCRASGGVLLLIMTFTPASSPGSYYGSVPTSNIMVPRNGQYSGCRRAHHFLSIWRMSWIPALTFHIYFFLRITRMLLSRLVGESDRPDPGSNHGINYEVWHASVR